MLGCILNYFYDQAFSDPVYTPRWCTNPPTSCIRVIILIQVLMHWPHEPLAMLINTLHQASCAKHHATRVFIYSSADCGTLSSLLWTLVVMNCRPSLYNTQLTTWPAFMTFSTLNKQVLWQYVLVDLEVLVVVQQGESAIKTAEHQPVS